MPGLRRLLGWVSQTQGSSPAPAAAYGTRLIPMPFPVPCSRCSSCHSQEMTCWGHSHVLSPVAQLLPQAPCAAWLSLPSFAGQPASFHLMPPTGCTVPCPEAKHSDPTLDTFFSTLDNALCFPALIFYFIFCWLLHPSFVLQVCSLLIGWGPVLLTPALVMSGLQLCQRPELALGARLDRRDGVRWRVE